ncbi:hypothetical protein RHMOL_Rhmol01G0274800 [Rhododendron molle]|uniref:Uncharacterized protein n=1 Tax=Rhododendron molle TaxID=49168 RepID=A0ACC0Q7R9_RHOML|nr:hypothetical protein RHMOL_Rhmol01G0274800 [Rhododendron molle]
MGFSRRIPKRHKMIQSFFADKPAEEEGDETDMARFRFETLLFWQFMVAYSVVEVSNGPCRHGTVRARGGMTRHRHSPGLA